MVNTVSQVDDGSSDVSRGEATQDEGAKLAQTVIEGLENLLEENKTLGG